MTVEVPVGGQWEIVDEVVQSINAPYTLRFKADGSRYRTLRFLLGFAGHSLNLYPPAETLLSGSVSRTRNASNSGDYLHPHRANNQHVNVFLRGTGFLQGHLIPRRDGTEAGWLMYFRGFSAYSSNWNDASGEHWSAAARLYWWKTTASPTDWDFGVGFGSSTGDSGTFHLLLEGERA